MRRLCLGKLDTDSQIFYGSAVSVDKIARETEGRELSPARRHHAFIMRWTTLAAILAAVVLSLPTTSALARESRYAAIIVEADSGHVIEATNPDRRCYPASLTKVMTLYLLFDALDQGKVHLDTEFPVSAHAAGQAPSKLGLRPGEKISVENIILALVTKSANDAAVVAAEGLGGSEPAFAAMMTRKARELGMNNTTYRNASGLPNRGQMTTPRDQALLARAIIHDHARYYHFFATREFTFQGHVIPSHNRVVLHYPGADGLKTGYINASGFNLITSAVRGGHRLVGVVFGGQTAAWRDKRMMSLLDKGFARVNGGGQVEEASADDTEAVPPPAPVPHHAAARHAAARPAAHRHRHDHARLAARHHHVRHSRHTIAQGDDDPAAWGIQVGAFSGLKPARHAAAAAARKLGGLIAEATIEVAKQRSGHRTVYRARLTGFTEDQAHAACRKLAKSKKSCRVVTPNA